MPIDPQVRAYYERGEEAGRLQGEHPAGPLELERTRELILRFLPDEPQTILDVGGGPGAHATWLVELGHTVHVVDPVPLHVEQARAADHRITAEVGDGRALEQDDGSYDVVLTLGPLYHLQDRDDRLRVLREAGRVVRPGGWVFAAAISRFAALFDLLVRLDRLHEPEVRAVVTGSVTSGVFRGPDADLFTNAYFHLPRELREELAAAGLAEPQVFNIEGPGFVLPDLPERWADPDRREAILAAARLVESEPELLGAAAHLLGVARRPAS